MTKSQALSLVCGPQNPWANGSRRPTDIRIHGWSCSLKKWQCFRVSLHVVTHTVRHVEIPAWETMPELGKEQLVRKRARKRLCSFQCRHSCSARFCLVGVFLLLWGTVSQPRHPLRMEMMIVWTLDPPASVARCCCSYRCVPHLGIFLNISDDLSLI